MTLLEAHAPRPRKRTELDMAAILAPLPGNDGAGEDVRYMGDHDRIRAARKQDDPTLPQGIWGTELKRANWDDVVIQCQDTLVHRSKDLQVAVWLVEALVQRDGFAGLDLGLTIVIGLCRTFWPVVYPPLGTTTVAGAKFDDHEARVSPFVWLDKALPQVLNALHLTQSGGNQPVAYSWTDYKNAERGDSARQRGARPSELTVAAFQASVTHTPTEFLRDAQLGLRAGLKRLEELDWLLNDRCGNQAPSLANLRGVAKTILGWLDPLVLQRPPPPAATEIHEDFSILEPMEGAVTELARPAGSGGPIASRDEAYRRLNEVADFLLRTEPHSPAPYVLKRICDWSKMSLGELLADMSQGRGDLRGIMELLGTQEDMKNSS